LSGAGLLERIRLLKLNSEGKQAVPPLTRENQKHEPKKDNYAQKPRFTKSNGQQPAYTKTDETINDP
jgi:hypothetical protein